MQTSVTASALDLRGVKGLHFGHLNIRSILANNNTDLFRDYLMDSGFHYFCIGESWLTEKIPDANIHIPGYSLTRLDRQVAGRGGGLLTYIKHGITYSDSELAEYNISNDDIELQWVVIAQPHMRRLVVANVYRPPSSNLPNAITLLSNAFYNIDSAKYPESYIMGDFNTENFK